MCGIVGIFDSRGRRPIDRTLLSRMNDRQGHRGPDDSGLHLEPGIGLGHRRLAIIDLTAGHQPLFNEDRSVVVVYNGEIYNFQELTRDLVAAGHRFRSRCDGIVGIFDSRGRRPIDRTLLSRMNDRQGHRGPDDSGLHLEPGIGLGHRRLAIIDLTAGHQPLFNEDRSVVVVYNGEIYNFQELTRDLVAAGHRFRSRCDTEVIVHAWEEWGDDCVTRFRGMFAFALWDQGRQTLFLARDRLGIKPIYYAELADGTFLFGSELKSLLVHPGLPRDIDPCAVEDYFAYGYVPDPKTIYRGVSKLAPGHVLSIRRGEPITKSRSYWDVSFPSSPSISEAEASEELIHRLREAVRVRMVADVPLGAFLSGGVDSSSVVAMMAGLSPDPVNTCSIGFRQADFDESRYAAGGFPNWPPATCC